MAALHAPGIVQTPQKWLAPRSRPTTSVPDSNAAETRSEGLRKARSGLHQFAREQGLVLFRNAIVAQPARPAGMPPTVGPNPALQPPATGDVVRLAGWVLSDSSQACRNQ